MAQGGLLEFHFLSLMQLRWYGASRALFLLVSRGIICALILRRCGRVVKLSGRMMETYRGFFGKMDAKNALVSAGLQGIIISLFHGHLLERVC